VTQRIKAGLLALALTGSVIAVPATASAGPEAQKKCRKTVEAQKKCKPPWPWPFPWP
jgi:hypothetical protein